MSRSRSLGEEQLDQSTVEPVGDFALGAQTASSRGRSTSHTNKYTEFTEFVSAVIERAEVSVWRSFHPRLPYLSVQTEEWALHRVFLGAVIVTSKVVGDRTCQGYGQDCKHNFHSPVIFSPVGSAYKAGIRNRFHRRNGSGFCARTKRPRCCGQVHHPTAKTLWIR